jgi:hypothetical protein
MTMNQNNKVHGLNKSMKTLAERYCNLAMTLKIVSNKNFRIKRNLNILKTLNRIIWRKHHKSLI